MVGAAVSAFGVVVAGASVGAAVGGVVTATVGASVGATVGAAVGGVGRTTSGTVGAAVGATVGATVVATLGAVVGAAVGVDLRQSSIQICAPKSSSLVAKSFPRIYYISCAAVWRIKLLTLDCGCGHPSLKRGTLSGTHKFWTGR